MNQTIDMRFIRYLNLFERVSRVSSKHCFFYNNFVIFVVPSFLVSKAIGRNGENVRKLMSIMNKRIKIISQPEGVDETKNFISEIIKPIQVKNIQITGEEIVISADKQSRAILIGRNKIKLEELKKIVEEYFSKKLRIN